MHLTTAHSTFNNSPSSNTEQNMSKTKQYTMAYCDRCLHKNWTHLSTLEYWSLGIAACTQTMLYCTTHYGASECITYYGASKFNRTKCLSCLLHQDDKTFSWTQLKLSTLPVTQAPSRFFWALNWPNCEIDVSCLGKKVGRGGNIFPNIYK